MNSKLVEAQVTINKVATTSKKQKNEYNKNIDFSLR